ncbi:MAG: DUF2333 family protein [Pseudomonadota bacterium]|nr:DUF2333 family protein [Pseudomonadota bacterium]
MSVAGTVAHSTKVGARRLVWLYHPRTWKEKGILWTIGIALVTYLVVAGILGILWSFEPDMFDVRLNALEEVNELNLPKKVEEEMLPGITSTATAIGVARVLLDKPGGYLSNDVMPPGVYLDNIPNWEFGVLVQLRDFVRSMRNDFARAQTQSIEDKDLQTADPQFNFNSESWILPSTEGEYSKGIKALESYIKRLADDNQGDGQFYVRSDNLRLYLAVVEKRLGDMAQRLAAAVGQIQFNMGTAGERGGSVARPQPTQIRIKTSWWEIDDVFYEARGTAWALVHFLRAIQIDFEKVLEDKNAVVNLAQVIRELEHSQDPVWSPVILNGTGFGMLANHSLVLASYLARASAAIVDLRDLLRQG